MDITTQVQETKREILWQAVKILEQGETTLTPIAQAKPLAHLAHPGGPFHCMNIQYPGIEAELYIQVLENCRVQGASKIENHGRVILRTKNGDISAALKDLSGDRPPALNFGGTYGTDLKYQFPGSPEVRFNEENLEPLRSRLENALVEIVKTYKTLAVKQEVRNRVETDNARNLPPKGPFF